MIADLPRLHAVTDDRVIGTGGIVARAAELADAAGAALAVHLRTRAEGGAVLALARELNQVLAPRGAWLVVNDRADVARAAKARALVSGRGGLAVADARRVAPAALVMRSVHDVAEVRQSVADGADILLASTGAGEHPAEPDVVRVASATGKPVIAIGGITPGNAATWLGHGAWGVAAIRALWEAPSPGDAARAFLAVLPRNDTVAVTINGEKRQARRDATLRSLLADLGLDPRAVVVEHNRAIVRQGALDQARVAEGDAIELVHFVGGG